MKILLTGNYNWHVPIMHNCAHALERHGCTVYRFDSEDRTHGALLTAMRIAKSLAKIVGKKKAVSEIFKRIIYNKRRDRLLNAIDLFKPDGLVVMRLGGFDVDTLQMLRRTIITACWMLEPRGLQSVREEMVGYDLYYSMHKFHERVGATYLPAFAQDPENFFTDSNVAKDIPVLFVGSWSPRRQQWIESLQPLASRLTIIGWKWKDKLGSKHPLYKCVKHDWTDVNGLRIWYQRADIVININRLDSNEATGGNLRLADVPACGTVLLTEHSDDLENHFISGKEIIEFRSQNQMYEKCVQLIEDPMLRYDISQAGLKALRRIGSYNERMLHLLSDIERIRNQPGKCSGRLVQTVN